MWNGAPSTGSTANLFGLPLCYQYGIGSTGFGAWRELAAHRMSTAWVRDRRYLGFPLLYHARELATVLAGRMRPQSNAPWPDCHAYIHDHVGSGFRELPSPAVQIVTRYASVALVMGDFWRRLESVSKASPYPHETLRRALNDS